MRDAITLADEWPLLSREHSALLADHEQLKAVPFDMQEHARHKERLRQHIDRVKAYHQRLTESHEALGGRSGEP